jgi:predicted Rossmann fold flavoprotein
MQVKISEYIPMSTVKNVHAIVIGAGAAGLFCAGRIGQALKANGIKKPNVILIDHAKVLGEKIRISGGGRCNFTNINAGPANYISSNPHFCRSALARYTVQDFIALVKKYHINFHEKTLGQLFCDDSSQQIIDMLIDEAKLGGVSFVHPATVKSVSKEGSLFTVQIEQEELVANFTTEHLVIATGGLSIPATGATAFGYNLAEQFSVPVTKLRAGLVPLAMDQPDVDRYASLSGVSFDAAAFVETAIPKKRGQLDVPHFREAVLLTHRGLSGPAILQASSYWLPGDDLVIDLLPGIDAQVWLTDLKDRNQNFSAALASLLPQRFLTAWLASELPEMLRDKHIAQWSKQDITHVAKLLSTWAIKPSGTLGYKKAEVTLGGIDTNALSSQSMMVKAVPGLYFIGEVVDVSGWLGGYNFQWAWASAAACAEAITSAHQGMN